MYVAKPLRADARRNRERIVAAARVAFAEYGLDAQMDEIARRAELGVGTLYRHFPTKEALVAALVEARMSRMAELGREVLAGDGDPAADFERFIRSCAGQHIEDRALSQVISTQPTETFRQAAQDSGLLEVGAAVLERAQRAGAVRDDASVDDIGITMCGLGAVLESWGPPACERYVELLLAGLRGS
jgi:AcrR family transcriptional regulator